MQVRYEKECILQNVEMAEKFETCAHCVNLGAVLFATVNEMGKNHERYLSLLRGLSVKFRKKSFNELQDFTIGDNEVIAFDLFDKKVRIVFSSDSTLNAKLIRGLDLFPLPQGAVI